MKLIITLLALVGSAAAFCVQSKPSTRPVRALHSTNSDSKMETFERAVECAENFGFCDLDSLEELADDLEKFKGNFFEHGEDSVVMNKEIQDRNDVAEVLRLQGELRLRMEYLEDANLFAGDVHEETELFPEV